LNFLFHSMNNIDWRGETLLESPKQETKYSNVVMKDLSLLTTEIDNSLHNLRAFWQLLGSKKGSQFIIFKEKSILGNRSAREMSCYTSETPHKSRVKNKNASHIKQ
jgi:hypothetical protein